MIVIGIIGVLLGLIVTATIVNDYRRYGGLMQAARPRAERVSTAGEVFLVSVAGYFIYSGVILITGGAYGGLQ